MRQSEARTVYTREQANAGENNQGQNRQRHTGGGKSSQEVAHRKQDEKDNPNRKRQNNVL